MIAQKVFEELEPYLEVIDADFDPNWYRPKKDYVMVLDRYRSIPMYVVSLELIESKLKFETTDHLQNEDPEDFEFDLDEEVSLSFKVYELGSSVIEI